MGGMVTQSRRIDNPKAMPWRLEDPYTTREGYGSLTACTQTTTSYRTGRADYVTPDEPDPTTQAKAFERFRREYKSDQRPTDTGHPFSTQKQIFTTSHPRSVITVPRPGGKPYRYIGPLVIYPFGRFYGTSSDWGFIEPPPFDPGFYGPRAIAATAPTSPVANLAVTLAELKREGLPKLGGAEYLRERTSRARALGSEYLNVEFGWKPLVSDLNNAMTAIAKADALTAQYARDSGKIVRRGYEFPPEVLETWAHSQDVGGVLYDFTNSSTWYENLFAYNGTAGRLTETVEVTRKVYFKGAYTYHLPHDVDSPRLQKLIGIKRQAEHLLGLKITPEVLWNLQPWSWLLDWDGNLGANISTFTALSTDSLVIVYGYLMCETHTRHTYTGSRIVDATGTTLPDITNTYSVIKKERVAATPYGFGRNPADFSGRQWSILAALGMTKAPGILQRRN